VLTGSGRTAAAVPPHETVAGLLAWALATTLPSTPTMLTV